MENMRLFVSLEITCTSLFDSNDLPLENDNSRFTSQTDTIVALETSSEELDYVMSVYWHLFGSESDKELKALAEKISPMGSKFNNDILLNKKCNASNRNYSSF